MGSELVEDAEVVEGGDVLKSRIFRLRLPKRSVTNVIQKWVGEGNGISASELRQISKELRKSQRYKHALEVGSGFLGPCLLFFCGIRLFSFGRCGYGGGGNVMEGNSLIVKVTS